jgi:uncharacterized DUF497 family protein
MRIVWDEPKRLITLDGRGLDFSALDSEFFAEAITVPARAGRFRAIGKFRGTVITVIFAPLGTEAVSVISMRRANNKEREIHEAKGPSADR